MSMNSIMTNNGAAIALQALNKTNEDLATTQKRISTGLRVNDARDDAAAFGTAQRVRSDMAGLNAANEQLSSTSGLLSTTQAALQQISKKMDEVKSTLVDLADTSVTGQQRLDAGATYSRLRVEIARIVNDSSYVGVSLLGRSAIGGGTAAGGNNLAISRNERGEALGISGAALLPTAAGGGHQLDLMNLTSTPSAATAREYLSGLAADGTASTSRTLKDVEDSVNTLMAQYANSAKTVTNQIEVNEARMAAMESGLGQLVDADLAKESARLQSLQIRQQLGATALSTANSAPQFLVSLFR